MLSHDSPPFYLASLLKPSPASKDTKRNSIAVSIFFWCQSHKQNILCLIYTAIETLQSHDQLEVERVPRDDGTCDGDVEISSKGESSKYARRGDGWKCMPLAIS